MYVYVYIYICICIYIHLYVRLEDAREAHHPLLGVHDVDRVR